MNINKMTDNKHVKNIQKLIKVIQVRLIHYK